LGRPELLTVAADHQRRFLLFLLRAHCESRFMAIHFGLGRFSFRFPQLAKRSFAGTPEGETSDARQHRRCLIGCLFGRAHHCHLAEDFD
jgi:hypothetical protein